MSHSLVETARNLFIINLIWELVIPAILAPFALVLLFHGLSGGYWPEWYYNMKVRREKKLELDAPITLGLSKNEEN